MSTAVSDTSVQAYAELLCTGQLTKSQEKVFSAMQFGRDYSLSELAQMTGIDKSSVSARINELKSIGSVVLSRKRACNITKKTVKAVKKAVH